MRLIYESALSTDSSSSRNTQSKAHYGARRDQTDGNRHLFVSSNGRTVTGYGPISLCGVAQVVSTSRATN